MNNNYHNDYSPRYQKKYNIYEKAKKHMQDLKKNEIAEEKKLTGEKIMQEETIYDRTNIIIGEEAVEKLKKSRVAIFGIGGVGGHAVEALVRAGIGEVDLVDHDCVTISNINRQLIATMDTVGRKKVEAMKERMLTINPEVKVNIYPVFYLPETADQFDFSSYDYIVDAVDTVTAKLEIVENANRTNTPVISCMGAGNKLDPTRFEVADIYKTSVCPLARVMRKECRDRNIEKLKVVYSKEPARKGKGSTPGSISFVPSVAGLIIAGEVIKDIAKLN